VQLHDGALAVGAARLPGQRQQLAQLAVRFPPGAQCQLAQAGCHGDGRHHEIAALTRAAKQTSYSHDSLLARGRQGDGLGCDCGNNNHLGLTESNYGSQTSLH